jgi:potassium-transporting ATPase KdpC subunit
MSMPTGEYNRMRECLVALRLFIVMSLLTGLLYPLAVTGVARCIFPSRAQGSLIVVNGTVRGSSLIGQTFIYPAYFQSRPSATGYSALPSCGSNLNVAGTVLRDSVAARERAFRQKYHVAQDKPVPRDMLFASGSGLDLHISPEAAYMQIATIVAARGLSSEQQKTLEAAVGRFIEKRQFGLLGEPRIAVVPLNLFLDREFPDR